LQRVYWIAARTDGSDLIGRVRAHFGCEGEETFEQMGWRLVCVVSEARLDLSCGRLLAIGAFGKNLAPKEVQVRLSQGVQPAEHEVHESVDLIFELQGRHSHVEL
jgi:hypothetical protein